MEIAKLQQNIRGAFLWLTLLTVAAGVAFLFLTNKIDNGFDKDRSDTELVKSAIASQTATLASIDARMQRSENRLDDRDDHSQGGDRGK